MGYVCRYARVLNGWPPNSSDISPIENLWAIMKERLTIKPKSKLELKQLIKQVYDSIDLEIINHLIYTFEFRIQMVKDFGRKTIAHFIRKKYHSIPDNLKVPDDQFPPILELDIYLKIYLENLKTPRRWTAIAKNLGDAQNVDNIIAKNKALEIERKINDYKKHHDLFKKVSFELQNILEYLNDTNEEKIDDDNLEYMEEEEEEEFEEEVYEENEEEDENTTNDEAMNPY